MIGSMESEPIANHPDKTPLPLASPAPPRQIGLFIIEKEWVRMPGGGKSFCMGGAFNATKSWCCGLHGGGRAGVKPFVGRRRCLFAVHRSFLHERFDGKKNCMVI